ncbi:MAG: hypothetical protein J3R72DRAFT_484751 [Linnemannia gamsii]|nr:MAG: hypothetical protein J3R72DRAFT_484751 [Linnemannia gamsii]
MTIGPCLSATRVFNLPELLTPIGSYLDPPDLLPGVKVCQLWNQVLIPLLWRVIDDSRYSWPNVLAEVVNSDRADRAQKEEQLRDVFTKYGRHIRDLHTDGFLTIVTAQAAGSCINLRILSIEGNMRYHSQEAWGVQDLLRGCVGSDEVGELLSKAILSPVFEGVIMPPFKQDVEWISRRWIFTQRFWLLVLQNPQLEGLRFGHKAQIMFLKLQDAFIGRTLASLPKLTRLDNHLYSKVLSFSTVLEHLPQVQHYASYIHHPVVPVFDRTFPQLQTFRSSATLYLREFFSLLSLLPNLEQLWIRSLYGETAQSMGIITNTATSRLLGLHFTDASKAVAKQMEPLLADVVLPRVPRLTSLSLRALYPSTVAALARHCPRLQSFQQIYARDSIHAINSFHFEVNVVGTLLRQCPNLTTLDAINYSIEADYLLAEPWVCRDLQTFRCQITGMNRSTVEKEEIYGTWATKASLKDREEEDDKEEQEEEVDPDNKDEEQDRVKEMEEQRQRCHDLHERVYSRLAEMTRLRVLDLGNEFRYPYEISSVDIQETMIGGRLYAGCSPPIANTLKLTLESGLGQLRSLKNLEVFGFEGVDHRIETKELAWMAESWPRLRIMRGLHDLPPTVLVANDPKTRMLRETMEELRPYVKHEALGIEHAMFHLHEWLWSAL